MELNLTQIFRGVSVQKNMTRRGKFWLTATVAVLGCIFNTTQLVHAQNCVPGQTYEGVSFGPLVAANSAPDDYLGGALVNFTAVTSNGVFGLTPFTTPIPPIPAYLNVPASTPSGGGHLDLNGNGDGTLTLTSCVAIQNPYIYILGNGISNNTTLSFGVPVTFVDDINGTVGSPGLSLTGGGTMVTGDGGNDVVGVRRRGVVQLMGSFNTITIFVDRTAGADDFQLVIAACTPYANIGAAERITSIVPAASGVVGNFDVTFELVAENRGSVNLANPNMFDNLPVSFLGNSFVSITSAPVVIGAMTTATTTPTLDPTFDGNGNVAIFDGASGLLAPGERIVVQFTAEINPNGDAPNYTLSDNYTATGDPVCDSGTPLPGYFTVLDDSDSGSDASGVAPGNTNPGQPGDTGIEDDPTPVEIPDITTTKQIVVCMPSASLIEGHVDITFQYAVKNTGNVTLNDIDFYESFPLEAAGAFIQIVNPPQIVFSTATADPNLNGGYDGVINTSIFDGTSGTLDPDQYIYVQVTVEYDPDAATANVPFANDIESVGHYADPIPYIEALISGNFPFYPYDASGLPQVWDNSDSGNASLFDVEDNNDLAPGASQLPTVFREDDHTPVDVMDIRVTKEVIACNPSNNGNGGNLDVTFHVIVQNTGNVPLTNIQVVDYLATTMAPFYVGITSPAVITVASAGTDPTPNPAFDGNADVNLFAGNDGLLNPAPGGGDRFEFEYTVEFDPNATLGVPFNQVLATANGVSPDPFDADGLIDDQNFSYPAAPKIARDESDAGNDPQTDNPTYFGNGFGDNTDADNSGFNDNDLDGHDTFDDPTPVPMPRVNITKEVTSFVESASGIPGNYDVTFHYIIENTGNIPFDRVDMEDDMATQLGINFVQILSVDINEPISTAYINPVVNGGYDGGLTSIDVFDQTSGYLAPAEFLDIDIVAELNLEAFGNCIGTNQAFVSVRPGFELIPPILIPIIMPDGSEKIIDDLSDSGNIPESTNPGAPGDTGFEDDPTPIQIPDVHLSKAVVGCVSACDAATFPTTTGNVGNYAITIQYHVKNTGSVTLNDLQISDGINPGNLVSVLSGPTILFQNGTIPAAVNPAYDANIDENMFLAGNQFDCGQEAIVEVTFEFDPNADPGNEPYPNTAFGSGDGGALGLAFDQSDSGFDPDSNNDGEPGSVAGEENDPTLLMIPVLNITKEVLAVTPALSGTVGNFDVTYHIVYQNNGNVDLANLSLTDNLAGLNVVSMVTSPFATGLTTATVQPVFNNGFDGIGSLNIFDGTSGLLRPNDGAGNGPGELVDIQFTVEIDANNFGACAGNNQAFGIALGIDPNGNPVQDPTLGGDKFAADLSDSGNVTEDPNDAAPGASAGGLACQRQDDPTPVTISDIRLVKAVVNCMPAASGTVGNFDIQIAYTLKNTGNSTLTNVQLNDFINPLNNVAIVTPPAILFTDATIPPTVDPAYNGLGTGNDDMFDATPNQLDCGQFVTVIMTFEFDANGQPGFNPYQNNAIATGTDALLNTVLDISDSGFDPDGNNDGEPGAVNGQNFDPTLLMAPSLDITKEVTSVVPSASGIVGHYDVTFHMIYANTGNVNLDKLQLTDNLAALNVVSILTAPYATGATTATTQPVFNNGYNGLGSTNIFDGTSGLLAPYEVVDVEFAIEVDATLGGGCNLVNQASGAAHGLDPQGNDIFVNGVGPKGSNDLSDSGNVPESFNIGAPGDTGGEDDPTPVSLPGIAVSKAIVGCTPAASGTVGNVDVTLHYVIANTGNSTLNNVQLVDGLNIPNYVAVQTPVIILDPNGSFAPNPGFVGDNTGTDDNALAAGATLACGQQAVIEITFEFDPNADYPFSIPYTNTAVAQGVDNAGNSVVDLSDSGFDPLSSNDGEPGSIAGATDDPTLILVPQFYLTKEVLGVVPASSGVSGNFDVTYHIIMENTGNVPLYNLAIDDGLLALNLVGIVNAPFATPATTATVQPVFNNGYDGFFSTNITDGTSGLLETSQIVDIKFTVEINAEDLGNCATVNQASGTALGLDPDGNTVQDPGLGGNKVAMDDSDSGNVPESNNIGAPGDTGGEDDPTPLSIPSIAVTKEVISSVYVGGCPNKYTVTFHYVIKNTGIGNLTGVQLLDNFNTQFDGGLMMASTTVVTGPAVANPAYVGLGGSAINSTGPLGCGQTIDVTVVAVIDPDATAGYSLNQALATANAGAATDLSDSGNDPDTSNDSAPGATTGNFDDPTPVPLPNIVAQKTVISATPAATVGNFNVTYHIAVRNAGNDNLDHLTLTDVLSNVVSIVAAPHFVAGTNANTVPVLNNTYNGSSQINIFDGTSGLLEVDQSVVIEFTAEINASGVGCSGSNQATAGGRALDYNNAVLNSPLLQNELSDNPATSAVCKDPTPVPLPDIRATKEVVACTPFNDSNNCTNTMAVTFHYIIKNTGNTTLTNLGLVEVLNSPTNLGGGLVSIITPASISASTATTNPTLNAGFNGTGNNNIFNGTTGALDCGQTIDVLITVQIDPNAPGAPIPMTNQALAQGTSSVGVVNDLTDSGNNPDTTNDTAPGATPANEDDPTPVYLPSISAAKEVLSFAPAASGTIGNFDVTFNIHVTNSGNVNLDRLQVTDPIVSAANWVGLVVDPYSTALQNSTIDPVYEPGFAVTGLIFDGTSGLLKPGQFLDIVFKAELDADALCGATNQVTVFGRGVDANGNFIPDPAAPANPKTATDLSDSGNDPNSNNPSAPGNTGMCDDPTPIELPSIQTTKEVTAVSAVADPTGCTNNFNVTFRYVVENNGSIPLTGVSLVDQLSAAGNLGAGFVSLTSTTVNSGPATANGAYTGSNAASLINPTGPLPCSQQIVVTVVAVVNADLSPVPSTNQGVASGNWSFTNTPATTGNVTDQTDSGNNPESPNDAAPGATLGGLPNTREDNPTPVYLPRIRASKEVLSFVPASSGTIGNFDVSFRVQIRNSGNVPLIAIRANDLNIPGANFVKQVVPLYAANFITLNPVIDPGFFNVYGNMLDGNDSQLNPDETLDLRFTAEMNADAICLATNQVSVSGTFTNPATGAVTTATDLSDSGSDPNSNNATAAGSAAGCNDATPIELPDIKVTKEVSAVSAVADPTGCSNNYNVTFRYVIKNTGSIPLNTVLLTDQLNAAGNLAGGFVSVSNVTVVSGPASANGAYNGTSAVTSAITSTGPLACGSSIIVTITAIANSDLTPVPTTNQATASASYAFTNTPATTGSVNDLSDSGNNPDTFNNSAPGATPNNGADPTPVYLPNIKSSKEVVSFTPAASGTIGNFDVTFRVRVLNTGNVSLKNLQVADANVPSASYVAQLVAPHAGAGQNSTVDPVYDPGFFLSGLVYDGTSGQLDPDQLVVTEFTLEMNADAICLPTNQVTASGNFTNPATGAVTTISDLSDSGTNPNSSNATAAGSAAGCNDATPVEIPDIKVTKEVSAVSMVSDPTGCSNNYNVTFSYVIKNTGSIPLNTVLLTDQLNAAGNLGGGFVSLTNVTVVSGPATVNGAYNGTSAVTSAITSSGPLACGSTIVVTITAIANADLTPVPTTNQATASASYAFTNTPATTGSVNDLSDSGNNPDTYNNSAPGATPNNGSDPTPVYLPKIKSSKEVLSFTPAASGVIGNFDVTYRVRVQNTGNVNLDRLQIQDLNVPSASYVALLTAPFAGPGQNSTVDPVFDPGFFTTGLIYDGTSGVLAPDQLLVVDFKLEMNADAICLPTNQVNVTGNFTNPSTNVVTTVTDLSDSGTNPNSSNATAAGSAAGCNDATPVEIPDIKVTKEVSAVSMVSDPTGCSNNYNVTFRYVIKNTGSIPLNTVLLTDQLNAAGNLGAGFVSLTNVTVVSGPAAANGAYNGTSAATSAITSTGPLACSSSIVVTVTAVVNADLTPVPASNQATVSASYAFTNTPATTGTVSDVSDSGNNPDTYNNSAPGATPNNGSDPTPVYLPKIKSSKELVAIVPAASGAVGNFDVTFRVRVQNTGNVPLKNIQITDLNVPSASWVALLSAPHAGIGQNSTVDPVYDPGFFTSGLIFDGTSGQIDPDQLVISEFTMEMNADAICQPTNQVNVSGTFTDPAGTVTTVTDLSDGGTNPNSNNAGTAGDTGGCNDPLPIEIPDIKVSKEVSAVSMVTDPTGCSNNYNVTFRYVIENTGSIPLTGVTLKDQLNAAGNLGAGFVSVSNVTVVSGPATANGAFNGTSAVTSAINATGPLACNTQIIVTITAIINADLAPVPSTNQAVAMGNYTFTNTPATTGMVTDNSDSGNNPESFNNGAPGATPNNSNDPTPVYLPKIKASKEVLSVAPAASGTIGNFDVTMRVRVQNTGNVPLDRLQIQDLNVPSASWVAQITAPFAGPGQNSQVDPVFDPGFFTTGLFYDGTSGQLNPDQLLVVDFKLEMNADAICQPTNQVNVSGRFFEPVTGTTTIVTDVSDSGSNPNSNNAGAAGDTGGCNDATPIEIPDIKVTKEVTSAVMVADPTGCTNNYTVTFKYTVENTGSIPLTTVQLFDQLNAAGNLGAGFVNVVSTSIISGPATANAGYTGNVANQTIFNSTGPLACNTQIMAQVVTTINADLTPVPATNQATASAGFSLTTNPVITGTVVDLSDSGTDPESPNDLAAGASTGGLPINRHNDATPVYLPKIKASKEVLSFVPAASGIVGNFDVSFRIRVQNTGNVNLDRIQVQDLNIPGVNWVGMPIPPHAGPGQNSTIDPVYDPGFASLTSNLFFDGTSGLVAPDQIVEILFTAEMNADAGVCQPSNQVLVQGRFVNPATQATIVVTDVSDSGSDPNSSNAAAAGSAAGCNDATPIEIPAIAVTKEVTACTQVPDPTGCTNNYNVTFKYTIENLGTIPLTGTTLKDQFNAASNFGAGFVSVTNVTVVSGPATAVAGFTGTSATQSAINATTPLLCNSQIMVTISVIINSDLSPVPTTNQAVAMANYTLSTTPPITGMVSDNSDSGSDPDSFNNNAPGATPNGKDDPTPVPLPNLHSSKEVLSIVPAASGIIGNFDVSFRIRLRNTGNVFLDSIQVQDLNIPGINWVKMVIAPHAGPTQNSAIDPVYEPGFASLTSPFIFDGTSGLMLPDQTVEILFTAEINADVICQPTNQVLVSGKWHNATNTMSKKVTDLSDSGSDPNGQNASAPSSAPGCNDATPIEVPDIRVTKEVSAMTPVVDPSGCSNNYDVTFRYIIKNTGSIPLTGVSLKDQLNSATNLGGGFVSLTNVTVVSGPATANGAYNGTSAVTSAINATGPLACGQTIVVTISAVINPDLTPYPAFNQAVAMGNWTFTNTPATTGMVSDDSDSGNDPDGFNNNAPGATPNNEDDPTPVYLPRIKASKEVVSCMPAANGKLGDFDVTLHFRLLNTGNTALNHLCLTDAIATQMGANTIVKVNSYGHTALTNASIWPVFEPGFNGGSQPKILDCTSGLLLPDQIVDITVSLEINPNATGYVLPALNQATANADGVLPDGNTPIGKSTSDLTDGGSDPNGPNTGYPGNTGGCNDATPISLPQLFVAKEIIACVPTGPFDPGDFNVTFKVRIENTGNVRLRGVTAIDNIAAQIGAAFEQVITPPSIVVTGAGAPAPLANLAYNGTNNLLQANNSILNPGGTITITWTAKINPNALLPNTNLSNQVSSTATGLHPNVPGGLIIDQVVNDPTTGQPKVVSDLSDSGSIPESYNVGEPGDSSNPGNPFIGEDDPTPIEIPSINASKKVIACMPSGNTLPGMFDITFRINVENTGNVNLDELVLDDNIFAGLNAAYVSLLEPPHIVNPPLLWLWPPTMNAGFDGKNDVHIFNLEYNRLDPGQIFGIEFKIRVNPNANLPLTYLFNQATASGRGVRANGTLVLSPLDGPGGGPVKRTVDLTDDGFVPESLNPGERGDNIPVAGTHDNPTPLEIPSINVAKYVTTVIKVPGEVPPGNARLTFEIKIENTGNVQLRNLMLDDAVRTKMGSAWLGFAPGGTPTIVASTAFQNPTLNAGFTGITGAGAMIFNGTTGRLDPGQTITVRITIDLDPNAPNIPEPLKNQATGKGAGFNWLNPAATSGTVVPVPDPNTGLPGPKLTTDLSDSGKIPESNNPGQPCDMGTHDDPTPFEIPFILASKWEIPNLMGMTCALSGVDGNIDITFNVKLVNVGNTDLDHVVLMDNLLQQFGSAFVKVIPGGLHIQQSTATITPTLDWTYNGNSQPNIFNGSDGLLKPNEYVVVRVIAEINPNAPGAPKPYDNQAMVSGRAKRKDGTLVFIPCTTNEWVVDDKSDGGDNPETVNLGWPGDTGGSNDPFDFRLPMTIKFPTNLTIYPSCNEGIEDKLLPWVADHGGTIVVPNAACGPMTWQTNFPNGGLNWLPADVWGCGCSGEWTISWQATDQCGHDVCFDAKLKIIDNAPPCFDMLPMDKTVVCGPGMSDAVQNWLDNVGGAWFYDNCSQSLDIWNDYNASTAAACDGDGTKVTFFLRDECGNVSSASANLRIIDEDGPTFTTVPANVTINCGAAIPAAGNVVALDDCTSNPTLTLVTTEAAGVCPIVKVITRTWTAKDLCGNTSTAKQTVTIQDVTKPTFTTVPANTTITCPAVPVFGTAVATDACSSITVTFVDQVIAGTSCPAGYTIRRTWTATDACGNTRTVARTIKVNPDPNPVVYTITMSSPSAKTIQCSDAVAFDTPSATSTCPTGQVTLTFVDNNVAGTCTTPAKFTRTWTAKDGCGTTKTASQTISQMPDNTAPTFTTIPADVTVACGAAPAFGTPVFTDNCTSTLAMTWVDGNNAANCAAGQMATKYRTWTVTDGCNHTATAKQTITEMPQSSAMTLVSVPAALSISCGTAVSFGTPVVTSTCAVGSVTSTFVDNTTGAGCNDIVNTRTWTYTDGCGHTLTASQTITIIKDVIAPVFTQVPGLLIVDCNTLIPPTIAKANDNCGAPTVTYVVTVQGNNPCAGMSGNPAIITWTATDACGNTSTATSNAYTSNNPSGISFISGPQAAITYGCGETMTWDTPVCVSGCTGTVKLSYTEVESGTCATGKAITRTWTATDDCGNVAHCDHTQYYAADPEPPVITFNTNNEIIECGQDIPTYTPDVTDNCSVQSIVPMGDVFDGNTLLRTWMATDGCGNTTTAVQTFTYQDTEAPVFTSVPANQTVQCGQPIEFGQPEVTDACNSYSLNSTDETIAGSCPGNYQVIRTWTATDAAGNTAVANATIFVKDFTKPVFAGIPVAQQLSCDAVIDIANPTATDCSGVIVTFSDAITQGNCTGDYIITRTWTATDGCGNVAIADAKVTLVDDIAPTFDATTTGDQTMTFSEFENWQPQVGATDNCGIANVGIPQTTQVVDNCQLTYLMNWTATDDCGNFSQQVIHVTITDEQPVISADALGDLTTGQTFVFHSHLDGGVKPFNYTWTVTGAGWYIIGGEGTADPILVAGTGSATLTLSVTNGIGCLTSETWTLDATTVGTNDLTADVFQLFPVPTLTDVNVRYTLSTAMPLEFRISDETGKLIEVRNVEASAGKNTLSFDLTNYAAGAYMLKIRSANGDYIVKPFVKQ